MSREPAQRHTAEKRPSRRAGHGHVAPHAGGPHPPRLDGLRDRRADAASARSTSPPSCAASCASPSGCSLALALTLGRAAAALPPRARHRAASTCSASRLPWLLLTVVASTEIIALRLALRASGRAQRGRTSATCWRAGEHRRRAASSRSCSSPSRTLAVGAFGLRVSRTMSDFYVASRGVGPVLNASAISGEYLSAASFLGAAGLILARGVDMLWLPVGWTAGYLVLLVFVAAPLRRSGAYTLPDFAQLRLESMHVRRPSQPARRGHRPALPHPAVPGRGPHPAHPHRGAALGGPGRRRRRRAASTSCPAGCAASRSCRPSTTGSSWSRC